MAHCTDPRFWKEQLERETRLAVMKEAPHMPSDIERRAQMMNPYGGRKPFFVKGWANMFNNDSAQARNCIAPGSENPLQSRRHLANMLLARNDLERVPELTEAEKARVVRAASDAPMGKGKAPPPEVPRGMPLSARRQARKLHSEYVGRSVGFPRTQQWGKMTIPMC